MRRDPCRVLCREVVAPFAGERLPKRDEFGGRKREGGAAPEGFPACGDEPDRTLPAADRREVALDGGEVLAGKRVKQRQMRRNLIALGREVAPPQVVETGEGRPVECEREDERGGPARLPRDQNFSASRASSSWAMAESISCWTL